LVTVPAQRDARGCARIGPLQDFVQRLDECVDARSLHHLVGQLHAAGSDDAARRLWVAAMRERFAATQAASFELDLQSAQDEAALADPAHLSPDAEQAARALRAALLEIPAGEAATYESVAAPCGGSTVHAAGVRCSATRAVAFALVRPRGAAADADTLLQSLAAIVWHLQCANRAAGKTRGTAGQMSPLELLQVLPLPSLITDGAGRALERNEAFVQFMDAIALRTVTGRLRFDDPYLQDSWQVALSEVDATAVRQSLVVTASDARQWHLHLVPLHCSLDAADPTGRPMILAVAEHQGAPMEALLDSAIAETARPLTPAEHEVLTALLQGHTAKVIANARGASVNTVRSQIMAILAKTGHHNQKTLMAAFASSSMFGSSGFYSGTSHPSDAELPPSRPPGRR
jgi:DNA-binding CsgD family transcriptional regulator/O6-methylguanine-DNA--protein-cysteine methyltransferase